MLFASIKYGGVTNIQPQDSSMLRSQTFEIILTIMKEYGDHDMGTRLEIKDKETSSNIQFLAFIGCHKERLSEQTQLVLHLDHS